MSQTIAMMATIRIRKEEEQVTVPFVKQWLEQYNMDNPVNLNECPRVELWTDTKWEPYKEDIQQTIRWHLSTYRKDFRQVLKTTINLDEGNKEWMYNAVFLPKDESAHRSLGSLEERDDR